jgi:hypothetical protein
MQDIGQALPSNRVAELGWRIAGGQAPEAEAVLVLTAWTLGNAKAALLAYRRRSTRSPARRQPPRAHVSRTKEGRSPMYSRKSLGTDPRLSTPAKAAHQ